MCLNLKSHSLSRCCLLSFSSLFNSLLTKRVYSCLISHFGVLGRRRPFSRQNRLSRFVHLQLGDDTLGRVDADLHGSACEKQKRSSSNTGREEEDATSANDDDDRKSVINKPRGRRRCKTQNHFWTLTLTRGHPGRAHKESINTSTHR